MAKNQATTFAFILSLVGGIIILAISLINVAWFSAGTTGFGAYGSYMRGAMDGYHNFMGTYATQNSFFVGLSVIAAICGVVVTMSAILLWIQPHQHTVWAIVIIAFSLASFIGMGGYFIGAILGIVGGGFLLFARQTNP